MPYKVVKCVGLNTDTQAAQVIYNFCDDQNIFLGVIKITGDNAFITGRQLLSELSNAFCEEEGSPGEKLTKAFDTAKDRLKEVEYDILLSAVSAKVLYLIARGNVAVVLKREQKISHLLSEGNEQLISGFLKEGDKALFATTAFTSLFEDNLSKTLTLGLEEWEDEVNGSLSGQEENDGLAAALLELEPELSDQVADIESNPDEQEILPLGGTPEPSAGNLVSQLEQEPRKLAKGLLPLLLKTKNLLKFFPRNGRARLALALVLLIIVSSVAGFKYWTGRQSNQQKESQALLEEARNTYNQAQGLMILNPTEAQNKIKQAKDLVNKSLEKNSKNPDALALKKELEQGSSSPASADFQSTEFLNLDSIKKDFKGSEMSLSGSNLIILDGFKNSVISTSLDKKDAKVLAEEDKVGDAENLNLNEQAAFIFSQDKGLLRIDLGNSKVSTVAKADKGWGTIKGISSFGSNIYLLDNKNNQIWKYLPTTSGYSDKRNYLTDDTKASFGSANDIQIDSSVYILRDGNQIDKFTKGNSDSFSITGLDKSLSGAKAIFVSDATQNLYVLDSGNSRLVVLSKSGTLVAQYPGDKFAVASDLVVDEKAKKVYLLDGSTIYQSDLK